MAKFKGMEEPDMYSKQIMRHTKGHLFQIYLSHQLWRGRIKIV